MIMAFLSGAWAKVLGFTRFLPWQAWAAIGFVLVVGLSYCAGDSNGYDRRDAEQAEIERKAAEIARDADSDAGSAVDQTKSEVEQGNEDARNAADGSDDPLRDGLNSLRD